MNQYLVCEVELPYIEWDISTFLNDYFIFYVYFNVKNLSQLALNGLILVTSPNPKLLPSPLNANLPSYGITSHFSKQIGVFVVILTIPSLIDFKKFYFI